MQKKIFIFLYVLLILSNTFAQKNLRQVEITTLSGQVETGKLLCVSDSELALWKGNDLFDWEQFDQNVFFLYTSEIDKLVIKNRGSDGFKDGMFYTGLSVYALGGILAALGNTYFSLATIGSLVKSKKRDGPIKKIHQYTYDSLPAVVPIGMIGGVIGSGIIRDKKIKIAGKTRFNTEVLTELKNNSLFISKISPKQLSTNRNYTPPYNPKSGGIKTKPRDSIFHFSMANGRTYTNSFQNIADAFAASGLFTSKEFSYPKSYKFCFEFNIINNFRLGLAISEFNQQIYGDVWESLIGTSYDLFLSYIPDFSLPKMNNWYEISIGAGLGYNTMSTEGNLFVWEHEYKYKAFNQVTGGYLRVNLDFLLTRRITFQLTTEGRLTPKINIPERIAVHSETNEVRKLNAHTIDYSAIDFSIGFRFHLY